ncbi:hypothetical protein LINGRAHAP2_LOCUS14382 [Linum grandiflorum]
MDSRLAFGRVCL